jgi:hypothetical protein
MSPALSVAAVTAAADLDPAAFTVAFTVQARAEPGVMPRLVELFAKRGLVPQRWHSTVSGPALAIELQMTGLGRDLADYIARCMRQVVGVEAVLTTEIGAPG